MGKRDDTNPEKPKIETTSQYGVLGEGPSNKSATVKEFVKVG